MDKVSNLNWPLYEMNKVGSISWIRSFLLFCELDGNRYEKGKKETNSNPLPMKSSTSKIGVRCCNYGVEEINSCFSHIIENPPPHK